MMVSCSGPVYVKPALIALLYTAAISQPIDVMITLHITVPHTNNVSQLSNGRHQKYLPWQNYSRRWQYDPYR